MIDTTETVPWLFDKGGKNISLDRYAELMEDVGYYRVAGTIIGGKVWVSTVWLGADVSLGREVFETMVFPTEPTKEDLGIGRRYRHEAQAMSGHLEIVEDICKYLNLPVTGEHIKEEA